MVVTLKEAAMYQITSPHDSPAMGWERTLCAFLAEKERRSGSLRTVQSYSRILSEAIHRSQIGRQATRFGHRVASGGLRVCQSVAR